MKQVYRLKWGFLLLAVLLVSCQQDFSLTRERTSEENARIESAREYFEQTIADAATRGILIQDRNWSPGDVTPQWDEATFKWDDDYHYVFVPMYSQYRYLARDYNHTGKGHAYATVAVTQLLCIRQDASGTHDAAYLTLIPSKRYYTLNKNNIVSDYLKGSDFHAGFTGRVTFNHIVTFGLMAVDLVVDGEAVDGLSRYGEENTTDSHQKYRELFEHTRFFRGLSTRSDIDWDIEMDDVVFIYCTQCKNTFFDYHWCPYDDPDPWAGENPGDIGGWGAHGGSGSTGSANLAAKIAEKANEYVKDPRDQRSYGANPPQVDCSMFAQEVAQSVGKTLPRVARDQADWFKNNGTFVTKVSDLKVGDFAYWSSNGITVSHTGIIVQVSPDIWVVHATLYRNKPESLRRNKVLSDGKIEYWSQSFIGGGRFK